MIKKHNALVLAFAFAFSTAISANAAETKDLESIRAEIQLLKSSYENRIQALENRLKELELQSPARAATDATVVSSSSKATQVPEELSTLQAPSVVPPQVASNGFNPAISLILGGTYSNLSQDPQQYRLQGFIPSGDEVGPGKRGFDLGESELTLSANVDHLYSGQLTFSLAPDNSASVEEAFFQTQGLSNGLNVKAGRFLSSIGYLSGQHAHAWDFVDAPLAYQAFLGGPYKQDGAQVKWLAPTELFLELGTEVGSGQNFPGNVRNKNGLNATALFAHVGDDIGDSASWRAGLSYLHTGATDRSYEDNDHSGSLVTNAFTGSSDLLIADAIYKWSPNGNSTQTNFKLQGEYIRRNETGTMTYDVLSQSGGVATGNYSSSQSGWYLQGIYQFMPSWRIGARYEKLNSGTSKIGLLSNDFTRLNEFNPTKSSVMLDYTSSEFSRFRLQYARDQSKPGASDNQFFIQYIMSLGAHGAHAF